MNRGNCSKKYALPCLRAYIAPPGQTGPSLQGFRETCSSCYCVYLGPQNISVLLGRPESVCLSRHISQQQSSTYSWVNGALNDWIHRQPILADEIQTFKALITIHKVLQEGHPVVVKEAQQNVNWVESLARGVNGEGLRGMC